MPSTGMATARRRYSVTTWVDTYSMRMRSPETIGFVRSRAK